MELINSELRVVEYVELLCPGAMFPESTVIERNGRTIEEVAQTAGKNVFAMITYKVVMGEVEVDGKTIRIRSERFDVSPRTYIGGTIYTVNELRKLPGNNRILISNIEQYPSQLAIYCRAGNWQPFRPEEGETRLFIS